MELKNKGLKNTLLSFEKNKENPFLKQAVEQVNNHVVKKYRTAGTTSQKAILRAVDNDNNIVGHTQFVKQIEVDEERFAKIYLSQFSAFFDLKSQGIKVFGYIMNNLFKDKDYFYFDREECLNYTGYKSEKSIYIGLADLIENEIIARGKNDIMYFINPMVFFNGDRITFAKTYVKKKKDVVPQNQSSLNFDNPEEPYKLPDIDPINAF